MEMDGKDGNVNANESIIKPVTTVELPKQGLTGDVEKDDETEALLPSRKGGLSKNSPKVQRKVQWNDSNGSKLVEVLEYQPSEATDSDDEEPDSCICSIM